MGGIITRVNKNKKLRNIKIDDRPVIKIGYCRSWGYNRYALAIVDKIEQNYPNVF